MRLVGTVNSIQLLGFVAATLVALFRSQQAFSSRVSGRFFQWRDTLFGFGAVGVHIIFAINGLLMVLTSVWSGKSYDAAKFFKRRPLPIYPICWLCVLAYIGVYGMFGKPSYVSGPLGDSSYVLYLIHIRVITVAEYFRSGLPYRPLPSPPVAALFIAIVSIALAEAIHRGIERPMLALLNPDRSLAPPRAREVHKP